MREEFWCSSAVQHGKNTTDLKTEHPENQLFILNGILVYELNNLCENDKKQ